MADFTVPGDWEFDGNKGNNQSTFRVAGHTAKQNYLVIFDRKLSEANGDSYTKPGMRIRIIRSFKDDDEKPLPSKSVADFNLSWPVEATPADVKAQLDLMGVILSDVEIASDFVNDQRIPFTV